MKYTEILTSIRQIVRSVNLESKRLEKEHGISIPQLLCLNYLKEQTSHQATHKDIKKFLQLNASTVTGIIGRLEKRGLVARLPKREDKRIGYITITAKGMDMLKKTPEPLHELLASKLQKLSAEELRQLSDSFKTIISFLDIQKVTAEPIISGSSREDHDPTEH